MKRFLNCILIFVMFILLMAGVGWSATYYVDKRLFGVGQAYCGSNPSDGDYVRIGLIDGTYKQYTFKTNLTPAEGEVHIGASGAVTTQNLSNAINASGGTNGVDYQVAAAHPAVSSVFGTPTANRACLTAKVAGGLGLVTLNKSGGNVAVVTSSGYLGDGNGSSASQATTIGGNGAFVSFKSPCSPANVPDAGTHTINVVANSGPYLLTDFGYSSLYYFYPNLASTMTYNFNSNSIQLDVDVNTSSYHWHKSNSVGKTDWYYLTTSADANPSLTQVKSAIINGYWSAESTNLVNVGFTLYGHYLTDNWGWGDYDTLGYNTLYVRYNGGNDPTGGTPIWITQSDYVIRIPSSRGPFTINDGLFRGGNAANGIASLASPTIFNRCIFYNSDQNGIYIPFSGGTNSAANYCKFINCGHRGVSIGAQANFTAYNNYFENIHMTLLDNSDTAYTILWKNNSSKNLLAGFLQHDNATPTLTESNNQIHLDPNSTHASKAIAFTGAVRQWTETAATDYPPSTNTSLTTSVWPLTLGDGRQSLTSKIGKPLIPSLTLSGSLYLQGTGVGLSTDFDGIAVGGTPNIGVYEGFIGAGGGLSPGLGLSGGNAPPWVRQKP